MKHLLNCKNCHWAEVVEGSSPEADIVRESHEESLRNVLSKGPHCPSGSVAWVTLRENAEVSL